MKSTVKFFLSTCTECLQANMLKDKLREKESEPTAMIEACDAEKNTYEAAPRCCALTPAQGMSTMMQAACSWGSITCTDTSTCISLDAEQLSLQFAPLLLFLQGNRTACHAYKLTRFLCCVRVPSSQDAARKMQKHRIQVETMVP
jgi:hypothetical protein